MLEQTKADLARLKFHGMLTTVDYRLSEATTHGWGHGEFLAAMVTDEKQHRDNKRIERLVRGAQFRLSASLEQFDTTGRRSVSRTQIQDLMTLRWLDEPRNVLLFGPTGVGKTFLATGLGVHACRRGRSCVFLGMNLFIEKLRLARADGSFLRLRDKLAKCDLLILDDLGIKRLPPEVVQDLYDILEERYQSKATVITTQLPIKNWAEIIEDPVVMEAIVDRLIHGCIMLEMKGESYRKKRHAAQQLDKAIESQ